jgi:hypothetical protein
MSVVGEDIFSEVLLAVSEEDRCTWLAQEGAPVMGVRPVCPSIILSSPRVNGTPIPVEGVVIGTPVASVTEAPESVAFFEMIGRVLGRDEAPAERLMFKMLTPCVGTTDTFL